jgi:hypothetical protein
VGGKLGILREPPLTSASRGGFYVWLASGVVAVWATRRYADASGDAHARRRAGYLLSAATGLSGFGFITGLLALT